jgi:Uma2 family endonuclease
MVLPVTTLPVCRERQPLKFTVAKFHRMAEAGVLDARCRYELIEGQIIRMTPPGPYQNSSVDTLSELLIRRLAPAYHIRSQGSVQLNASSEPLPDIAILKRRADHYARRQPVPGDVLLLIEVSQSTLAYDRGHKARIYAAAAIVEYWVLNLKERCLHVMRKPSAQGYRDTLTLDPDDEVRAAKVPELKACVRDLLLPE